MRRKRHGGVVDLSSSDGSDSEDFNDVQCTQHPISGSDSYESLSEAEVISDVPLARFIGYVYSVYVFINS